MTAPADHQKVLIVDFGSQVTQLIARRLREARVYCEIHPYAKAEAALQAALDIANGNTAEVTFVQFNSPNTW